MSYNGILKNSEYDVTVNVVIAISPGTDSRFLTCGTADYITKYRLIFIVIIP